MARYGRAKERIHRNRYGTPRVLTRIGVAAILAIAAPVLLLAAAVSRVAVDSYLIVDGDSMSGSWDGRDEPQIKAWRSRYGGNFAWFRSSGRDYIVTDEKILGEIRDAMAPQREVNARQSVVNREQAKVNHHQKLVNSHQSEVNQAQSEVNRHQEDVTRLYRDGVADADLQSRVNQAQSVVNARQSVVNEEQDKVNTEQQAVNGQQAIVNQMQERVSEQINRSLRRIFDDAMSTGLAREVD